MAQSEAFIAVDPQIEVAPHAQIFEQVRALIQRGEIAPGTLVPTVRQLAGDLNVAPNTVARAYADLQAEGWLHSDGRRGTRVAPVVPTAARKVRLGALRDAIDQFLSSLDRRGYSNAEISNELQRALDIR